MGLLLKFLVWPETDSAISFKIRSLEYLGENSLSDLFRPVMGAYLKE